MKELITTLQRIGLPADEITRVTTYYGSDIDGLRKYVLYMRAMFDDCHEYLTLNYPNEHVETCALMRDCVIANMQVCAHIHMLKR